uniref:U3 small nucleolar RNA-associated protein 6 homolog C-terminal domain-containing protein n=1 Tax=Echeneis naucrates TaxID=173247 RepID=A0A665X8N6_ECHNA
QVQWSAANQAPEETEGIFKVAHLIAAVAMEMKELYLDWSYSTGEYKKARKTFKSLQEIRPLSKAFFTRMIEIEKKQVNLWLQYIQEEMGPGGKPENCGKIHWRAMKFLEGESVERFTSRYTLLQTGHL